MVRFHIIFNFNSKFVKLLKLSLSEWEAIMVLQT